MPTDRDGNPCGVCALLRRAMGTAVRRGDSAALAKYLTTEKRHYARMHPGYGP